MSEPITFAAVAESYVAEYMLPNMEKIIEEDRKRWAAMTPEQRETARLRSRLAVLRFDLEDWLIAGTDMLDRMEAFGQP